MSKTTELSPESQRTFAALRAAATRALDRKRRLGHYAVIWENGQPIILESDGTATPAGRLAEAGSVPPAAETPPEADAEPM